MSLETAVRNVRDLDSLIELLTKELNWEIEPGPLEDITFEWSADDLKVSASSAERLKDGSVFQLRPASSVTNPPWGIFFVRFANEKIYRSVLRQVLRGLVPKQRRFGDLPAWKHENLLFICATNDYEQFTFAHFRGQKAETAVLSTFGWQRGDTHIRTLCEFNLPALSWPRDENDTEAWLKKWSAAFDVERVTDEFFRRYNEVFTGVEKEVKGTIKDERQARLFTQRLFNRLMFIYFIQKKGWLTFKDDKSYLRALFDNAIAKNQNFFNDRLYWLFFRGMGVADLNVGNQTTQELEARRGKVPPLNGGLFEIEDDFDVQGAVTVSNDAFARILALFERYNFTVEESTPLDVQVAVDPEMLGKVFEELVTGRHETGSYYTPRPIVSFMCREALKHYLANVQPNKDVISQFVDEEDASEVQNPEAVLEALKRVRVCDPACGSGAYLLGMLHELTRLRAALFKSKKIDDATLYERKRWIIENNLYGVDNDKFAVQIACLRLWLSLAIESDEPHPLPNLDFKIECGDSLIAPAPSEAEKQMTFARAALVSDFRQAKGEYMRETDPERKQTLRQRIEDLRSEIALALKHQSLRLSKSQIQKKREELKTIEKSIESARNPTIKAQLKKEADKIERALAENESAANESDTGFDWAVEFAEVFTPAARDRWRMDDLHPILNDFKHQGTLIEEAQPDTESGGFDIVVANPPYIRHRVLGRDYKEKRLRPLYEDVFSSLADLYVYFFARTQQVLKANGVGCFISSNKWLQQEYGEKLRQHLLDGQAFHLVVDFGELPVFRSGTAYTAVFLWQKRSRAEIRTLWAVVRDLEACYVEGVLEHTKRIGQTVPASQFGTGKPRLTGSVTADRRSLMEAKSQPLSEIAEAIFVGLQTSADKIYILDLIKEISSKRILLHSKATGDDHIFEKALVKPLLSGADVKRYEQPEPRQFIIFPYNLEDGEATLIPEKELRRTVPLTFEYLKKNKAKLEARETGRMKGADWYGYIYLKNMGKQESIKLCVPRLVSKIQTIFDIKGRYYLDNVDVGGVMLKAGAETNYFFVMAVLNSQLLTWYLRQISTPFRGGFYSCNKQYLSRLPIPVASEAEASSIAKLARQTQQLHAKRRKRVERFLREVGIEPASSRNPLEQPWMLTPDDFTRRARNQPLKKFTDARDETFTLTEQITKIEREIDERVAALYGMPLERNENFTGRS